MSDSGQADKVPLGNVSDRKFTRIAIIIALVLLAAIAAVIVVPRVADSASNGADRIGAAMKRADYDSDPDKPWVEAAKNSLRVHEIVGNASVANYSTVSHGNQWKTVTLEYKTELGVVRVRVEVILGNDGIYNTQLSRKQ